MSPRLRAARGNGGRRRSLLRSLACLGLAVSIPAAGGGARLFRPDNPIADPDKTLLAPNGAMPTGRRHLPAPPVRIEPGHGCLPANHLKFYLHFTGPMERGAVFQYLRLAEIDRNGVEIAEVPEPFREVELWDETFTRLTLWFHPGRQKPGVNLNVEIGPILEPGKRYRLKISEKWRTESGTPLGDAPVALEFAAKEPDLTQPNPAKWLFQTTAGRLVIHTDDLLDPASQLTSLSIRSADGKVTEEIETIRATVRPSPKPPFLSTSLQIFRRGGAWPPGRYRLIVDPKLEDLAGNSVARPFNVDLEKRPGFAERTEPVVISFEIPAR